MEVINVEALKGNFYCGSIIMILIACFMQIKIIGFPIELFFYLSLNFVLLWGIGINSFVIFFHLYALQVLLQ